ncbi:MAG: porin [Thermoguttaceae bacterium]
MKRTWKSLSTAGVALAFLLGVGIARAEEAPPKLTEGSPDGLSSADATTDGIETYERQEEAAAGWKLPQPSFLAKHGFTVGGWVDQGIAFNNHPDDAFNGPVCTNNWNGEYQLNQAWLFLDRPAKNDGEGIAWGAHLDLVYGTDWIFGISHGLEDRIDSFNRSSYGLGIPQAYAEVAINKLDIKLGHYAGILGYEVVAAPPNPFYTHSYAMCFSEPILVTGALAEYKLSEQWALLGGIDRGWMTWEDENNIWDFMGGIRWMSENKKTAVAYSVNVGPEDAAGVQQRFVSSLVFKQELTERLQYVLQHDLGQEQNALPNGDSAQWYGVNQYVLYKLNKQWSANFRGEWFRDNNGTRVGGVPEDAGIRLWSLSGFAGNFYEMTFGLNWRPNANVIFRPEIRYDWYDGQTNAGGLLPFNNGESSSQLLVAADLIFTF